MKQFFEGSKKYHADRGRRPELEPTLELEMSLLLFCPGLTSVPNLEVGIVMDKEKPERNSKFPIR